MKREIRFRVWDTKKSEWLDSIPPKEYMLDEDEWDHDDFDEFGCFYYPHSPLPEFDGRLIVEQFTGFKDFKGAKIYEGDLVNFTTRGTPHGPESETYTNMPVWFDGEIGCWVFGKFLHPRCDEPFEYGLTISGDRIMTETFLVVGNIHEKL